MMPLTGLCEIKAAGNLVFKFQLLTDSDVMAKKSKGKRGGDDKGADDAKERITEVDRESYLIQIKVTTHLYRYKQFCITHDRTINSQALEEKLQRRTDRMQQLEAANVEFHDKYVITF